MSDYSLPEHPAYDASPSGSTAPAAPKQVTTAFWLYILSAVISLVALIVGIAALGSVTERQLAAQGTPLSGSALSAAIAAGIAIAVVTGILYIAAYVLFAFFMRRGANWARIVLLIISAISVLGIFGGNGLSAARAVLAIIATVLIFLKPASDYFAEVKARKVH
jgi:K+-sensing histidine kinase KdpD